MREVAEHRCVPGNQPRIKQGGPHGDIRIRLGQAFAHRPGGVPHLQPEVPEEVEHEFHHLLHGRRRFLPAAAQAEQATLAIGRQEQQVDIAERCQDRTAVTAGRGNCHAKGGFAAVWVGGQRIIEQSRDQPVGQVRQQARRAQPGQIALLEHIPHMHLQTGKMPPEHIQRHIARRGFACRCNGGDGVAQLGCGGGGLVREGQGWQHSWGC